MAVSKSRVQTVKSRVCCLEYKLQYLESIFQNDEYIVQSLPSGFSCLQAIVQIPGPRVSCLDSLFQRLLSRVQSLESPVQSFKPIVQNLLSRFSCLEPIVQSFESRACSLELIVQSLRTAVQSLLSRVSLNKGCLGTLAQSGVTKVQSLESTVWGLASRV